MTRLDGSFSCKPEPSFPFFVSTPVRDEYTYREEIMSGKDDPI
ncbi:hypothetical protein HMPREF9374_3867 [Desmospora sp. 8437]|nr:hypothetical protein HMPREF9374_3867 [Desmospora sp. 8437]